MTRGPIAATIVVGVALLLVGSLAHAWWTIRDGDNSAGFGLTEVSLCERGHCETVSYEKIGNEKRDKAFVTAGRIAYFGSFVAAGVALVALGLLLARKRVPSVSPGNIAAALATAMLIAASVFIYERPADDTLDLGVGYGLFCYIVGALATGVGGYFCAKSPPA